MLVGFRAQAASWRLCGLADDAQHAAVTLRLVLSVVLMSGWQKPLLLLNAICTLKLKQLELFTDVTSIKCEVLLQHGNSLASGAVRTCSLSPVVLLQTLLLLVCVLFRIHSFLLSDSLPLSLTSLCFVLRSAIMCSVKPDGVPQLCRTDEVGELCMCAVATGMSYYGLSGMTKNTFEVGGR